ncbi:hypothetical protein [Streptomyces tendae]|uniref:hypothetical protein n=1 Tax=Streptomyces tendae TaxID=1932 RepID=UPI003EBE2778
MSTDARAGHRCTAACRCPVHRTALYYSPAGDLHACQDPYCRYAPGISAAALARADLGERMYQSDPGVFTRFLNAHQADPNREVPPAVPLGAALRSGLENRLPDTAVPDSDLHRLLAALPAEPPAPPGHDEDQALGRLAMTAETLRQALTVREAEAAEDLTSVPDGELHHLVRLVLDSAAGVLTAREPALARPAAAGTSQPGPPSS